MNSRDLGEQARLQELAEQAERSGAAPGSDPRVDRYRLVMRALRQPLAAQLPADFAARVAARSAFAEEKSSPEDWMMSLLLLAMAITALVYVQPVMASVLSQLHFKLPTLPWPLLGAALVSVAVAWALDRGAIGWRR